jgi:hypothetical protein
VTPRDAGLSCARQASANVLGPSLIPCNKEGTPALSRMSHGLPREGDCAGAHAVSLMLRALPGSATAVRPNGPFDLELFDPVEHDIEGKGYIVR